MRPWSAADVGGAGGGGGGGGSAARWPRHRRWMAAMRRLLVAHNNFSDQTVLFDAFYPRSALGAAAGNGGGGSRCARSRGCRTATTCGCRRCRSELTQEAAPSRARPCGRGLQAAYWRGATVAVDGRPEVGAPWAARAGGATLSNARRGEAAGAVPATDAPTRRRCRSANQGEDERKAKPRRRVRWLRSTCLRSTLPYLPKMHLMPAIANGTRSSAASTKTTCATRTRHGGLRCRATGPPADLAPVA